MKTTIIEKKYNGNPYVRPTINIDKIVKIKRNTGRYPKKSNGISLQNLIDKY